MSDLRELYQEVIIDHGRRPRNFGKNDAATHINEGFNPLCGDKLKLYLALDQGNVIDAKFEGCGCAISMASASLMTEAIVGKTASEAEILFHQFHELITQGKEDSRLGKLSAFSGVGEYPARVKCATLAWHTLNAALHNENNLVSTE
jgi:nitrogen fixation NifU-like protein